MREPYGSLVEFILRYNCGGGFGGIDGRVLECSNRINVRSAKQGYEIMVGSARVGDLLGNFQESETKVKSRATWFKENILKIEKVFHA